MGECSGADATALARTGAGSGGVALAVRDAVDADAVVLG